MENKLKILFVEDLPTDAELAMRTLSQAGMVFESRVVETETDFLNELKGFIPEIIISDYNMPQFNGMRALKLRLEKYPDIPFILLTGYLNEETAVECMKSGANDYVIKEHITRLPFAVKEVLEKNKLKLEKNIAEKTLIESEERFRSLYENSTIGLYRTTPDGKILLANPTLVKLLGYSSFEELAARDLDKDGFEPEYERKQFLERIEKNGEVIGFEAAWTSKDGKVVYISESAKAIRDSNGKTLYYDGTVEDITIRKKAIDSLRESESRFKQVSENAHELIWEVDENGLYTYINPVINEMLGYEIEEIVGKKHFYDLFDQKNREELKQAALGAFARKESFKGFVNVNRHKDGREIILSTSGIPLIDSKGSLTGYRGVDVDITERKRAEKDLIIRNNLNLLKAKIWEVISNKSIERDELINLMLEEAGNVLNISRAAFLELDEEKKSYVAKFQWYRPEVGSTKSVLIPKKYVELYSGQEYVQIPRQLNKIARLFALPLLQLHNIKSWMAVPYGNKNNPVGLFTFTDCFQERDWSDLEIDLLIDLSKILESFSIKREAEKMLIENEEKFRAVAKLSPMAVYSSTGSDQRAVYINETFHKIFGFSMEDVPTVGHWWIKAFPDEKYRKQVFDQWAYNIEQADKNNLDVEALECVCSCKDGSEKIIVWVGKTIGDEFWAFGYDITERKQVEEKIREKDIQFRKLSEQVPDLIFQFTRRPDGKYFVPIASEGIKNIFGCSPEDVLEDFTPIAKVIFPEDSARVISDIEYSAKHLSPFSCEFRVQIPGKSIQWINSKSISEKLADGSITWYGFNADITERKLAEETLRASEERFRTLFESALDGIFVADANGYYVDVNTYGAQMLGYQRDEIIGMHLFDLVQPEKTPLVGEDYKEVKTGIPYHREWEFKRKDGSILQGDLIGSTLPNGNVLGIVRDITERKRTEKLTEALYGISQAIFSTENIDEFYQHIHRDLSSIIPARNFFIALLTNDEKTLHFSYSSDEKDVNEVWTIDADDSQSLTVEVLRSKRPLLLNEKDLNYRYASGKNRVRETAPKCWLGVPLIIRGKAIGAIVIQNYDMDNAYSQKDVSLFESAAGQIAIAIDRKRAEEILRESEEKFRNLFEKMLDGVYESSHEGKFLKINNAMVNMLGYNSKEELYAIDIKSDLYFEESERESAALEEKYEEMAIFRLKKKDGSEIWVEDHGRHVLDDKGSVLYHEGVMRDVTERLRVEQELIEAKEKAEEMNRAKSNFFANMSHELRTPLVGILGFADILSQDLESQELKAMAETILKSGKRLSETLNLILDLSKFESEKLFIKYRKLDLVSKAKEIINSFNGTAAKKGIALKSSFSHNSIVINFDERAFHSILNNLINNALKFTSEGSVTTTISLNNDFVEIKVIDTGIGIQEKDYQIIFEEFRQASEGHSRNFEGSGLGLSITKKLVEKFGGTITVESKVGKGTTFTVVLPVTNAEAKEKEPTVREAKIIPEAAKQKSLKPIALLVDDDPFVFEVLKRYLQDYVELETTVDADFAIKKLKKKQYDLIFMDINLSRGMDGKEATKKIRTMKGYESIPIIATTGYAMVGDKEEFLAAGCSHYLSKPFSKADIIELLGKVLKLI